MTDLHPGELYGWEPTLCGGAERHLDDGPTRHALPRRPWASVWWSDAEQAWAWAVWPAMRRVQYVVMEQRRLGVGKAAESGQLISGLEREYHDALDRGREALETFG